MRNVALLTLLSALAMTAQTPPQQPAEGPGGADYPHASVDIRGPYIPPVYGSDERFAYYLFEPASPKPASAPVVLFLHGFQANSPLLYGKWMEHLVRKGYTVAWVRWDQGLLATDRFVTQAQIGWLDALGRLLNKPEEGHVPPAVDEQGTLLTGMVGHSAGAWIGPALAGRAKLPGARFPAPQALVAVEPQRPLLPNLEPLELIDPTTVLTILIGDDDRLVCDQSARSLWSRTAHIADSNRDYLVARSDTYGSKPLIAGHVFPLTFPFVPDALDFYSTWKISTATFDCAFRGENCDVALGNGAVDQLDTGQWSDLTPVEAMLWVADPQSFTPSCATPAP